MILARIGTRLRQQIYARQRAGAFQRPFDAGASRRLLLLAVDHRIPQSQYYPFHHYARDFRDRLDCDIREVGMEEYGRSASHPEDATTVCYQSHFDMSDAVLARDMAAIRARNPEARIIYMDWFAPTDLRMAARVAPHVDGYLTKHLLRDRARYDLPTYGDTTLMDYYGRRFGLDHEERQFPIPDGFWKTLHLGPSFATADFMLPAFLRGKRPGGVRPIDLHARIAVEGTPWYAAMRAECASAVAALDGVRCVTGTGIRHGRFLRELRASKVCFSPFGYGEVCWRDYEAVMTGAVLLKQDMSHVMTDPDIFAPDETYVPVRWDLSDFAERLEWILRDDAARARIACAAFERLRDYARSRRFIDQMAPVIGA
ncbi:glycosyltransferase family 1 protein [Roseovarius spongiae]|uniref:Glycosyltransferase family 1 protein n=1 Tax=Roseovarius spongiae TaxID=2320272 RepID=A0A3A8AWX0_9RHOB|nr:glycosyltransferase [Roseovarius spongiae]RKF16918.1 glycosyltransferase family 1 protein [Roseovarius spongiae]